MQPETTAMIRRLHHELRLAAIIEGITLLVLLFVAVPMKRVLGLAWATTAIGPVHGMAVVIYIALLCEALAAGLLTWRASSIAAIAAMIPFGTLVLARRRIAVAEIGT